MNTVIFSAAGIINMAILLTLVVFLMTRGVSVSWLRNKATNTGLRVFLAVTGAALIVAVGVATLLDATSRYTVRYSDRQAPRIVVPTNPVTPPTMEELRFTDGNVPKRLHQAKLFLYFTIVERIGSVPKVREVFCRQDDWDNARILNLRSVMPIGDGRSSLRLELSLLRTWWEARGTTVSLVPHLGGFVHADSRWDTRTYCLPAFPSLEGSGLIQFDTDSLKPRLLSLETPGASSRRELWLSAALATSDTLQRANGTREISLDEFAASLMPRLTDKHLQSQMTSYAHGSGLTVTSDSPGMRLVMAKGLPLLWLLIAALCLTLAFRRRVLAGGVLLFALMLYVVALDRATLAVHMAELGDKSQSDYLRYTAIQNLGNTFFYRETARSTAEKAAKEDASEVVRINAASVEREIQMKP